MTTPTQLAPTADGSVQTCNSCNHPDAAHDHIARRYCKATMTSTLSRNCICSPSPTL